MDAAKNEAGAHPAMSYTPQLGWEFQVTQPRGMNAAANHALIHPLV